MPKGKYRTARNVGFSSERLAPCIYRILAARAYFHGSSPRMWGTHRLQQHADAVLRFIPTHVGNTSEECKRSKRSAVHPHACGEHDVWRAIDKPSVGSSPRMWGTPSPDLVAIERRRFIPTHVGNTAAPLPASDRWPVHPHACGEHSLTMNSATSGGGSSPRMWGTRRQAWGSLNPDRFIPTHVGNTYIDQGQSINLYGSSPRMWGTPVEFMRQMMNDRFIPTHVGNTSFAPGAGLPRSVHPHACGEHTYRTELFLKKKKHLEKSTASSSIPWSDPEAGMPPIAARRTTLDVDG